MVMNCTSDLCNRLHGGSNFLFGRCVTCTDPECTLRATAQVTVDQCGTVPPRTCFHPKLSIKNRCSITGIQIINNNTGDWQRARFANQARARSPTAADVEASEEMMQWRAKLASTGESSGTATGALDEVSESHYAATHTEASASKVAASSVASTLSGAAWSRASEYHELMRSRVESQATVNGFEGVSAADVHAAAESFAAWDLDHDGVCCPT